MSIDQSSIGVGFLQHTPLSGLEINTDGNVISASIDSILTSIELSSPNQIDSESFSSEFPNTMFVSLDERYDNPRKLSGYSGYYLVEKGGESGILYNKNGEHKFLLSFGFYIEEIKKIKSVRGHFQISDASGNSGVIKLGAKQAEIIIPCEERFVYEEYENGHILRKNQENNTYNFIHIQDGNFIQHSDSFSHFSGSLPYNIYMFRNENNKTIFIQVTIEGIDSIAKFDTPDSGSPKYLKFEDRNIMIYYPQNEGVYFLYCLFEGVFSQLRDESYDVLHDPDENGVIRFARDGKWGFLRITQEGVEETNLFQNIDTNEKGYKLGLISRYLSAEELFRRSETELIPFFNRPGTKKES